MNNLEKIQSMSLEEMTSFLKELDDKGIYTHCSNEYCHQCKDRECETECRYKDVDVIKWWLSQECNVVTV